MLDISEYDLVNKPRIFQIGLNRCGTQTLDSYFRRNGVRSIHWDEGRLALAMFRNLRDGVPLLTGYEHYSAFTDMEYVGDEFVFEAYKLFPYIAQQYPDSVFILNTRDKDRWLQSRLNYRDGRMVRAWKAVTRITSDNDLIDFWSREWDGHHERVVKFFTGGRYRFLIFRIDQDGPEIFNEKIPEYRFNTKYYRVKAHGNPLSPAY